MVAMKMPEVYANYKILVISPDLTFSDSTWEEMVGYAVDWDDTVEALRRKHRWNQVWIDGSLDQRKLIEWLDAMQYAGDPPNIRHIYIQHHDGNEVEWMRSALSKHWKTVVCLNNKLKP